VKRETIRHPKTYDLAARLGCSRAEALGFLTLLWDFTGEQSPQGDVGKWGNGAIARACDYTGDPDAFVDALAESRWIDRNDKQRLVIHDWPDHCEDWVRKKLERMSLRFLECYQILAGSSVHKKRGNRLADVPAEITKDITPPENENRNAEPNRSPNGAPAELEITQPNLNGLPPEDESKKNTPRGVPPECENTNTTPSGVPPESLSKPNQTKPIQSRPNRTEPEGGRGRPPDGDGPGQASSGRLGSAREDFFLREADWPAVSEECNRLVKIIEPGKGGKWRDDRELIFKVAVLKHLGGLPEAIIADTISVMKAPENTIANKAAFFRSGLILRCGQQGIAFHELLAKVPIPDWAEPVVFKSRPQTSPQKEVGAA
jgi:hypothetical protein